MIEHTWAIFPKEITTTAIGVLCSIHWTGPSIVSSVAGGYLYQIFSGPYLFRAMSIIGGSWCIFMVVYFEIIHKKRHLVETCPSNEMGISHEIDLELPEITKKE